MQQQMIDSLTLYYEPEEIETARLVGSACEAALQAISQSWGLKPPADCRIYVMTDPLRFFFQSAPWSWRLLLGASVPLWIGRVRRTWPISAGWTQRFGKRVAIGVKPKRLLEKADRSLGASIFVPNPDLDDAIRMVTCHELTHACSAHLRLQPWLNEGLATVTAGRLLGKSTIRSETLELVRDYQPKAPPVSYRELVRLRGEDFTYQAVRGYWLVEALEALHPGLLKSIFSQPRSPQEIESRLAEALGLPLEDLWQQVDGLIADALL